MGSAEATADSTPQYYRLMEGQSPPPCTLNPLVIIPGETIRETRIKSGNIGIAEAVVSFEISVSIIYSVVVYVTVKPNVLRYWRETCSPIGQ